MSTHTLSDRKAAMGLLARARPDRLAAVFPDMPDSTLLRGPETGAVMVRGRQGGTGAPFNLGEVTITRCSVQLPCGTVGHAHVQGRDKAHARRAAVLDALLQTQDAEALTRAVLSPLAAEETARRETRARKAAATKVEFFTMVRGDD
ncbi:phosphonate C-P lyase system protein PhnG [Pararhodobacter zhoushanensis]|uniref:Phosphonate C-P lyase system protein PhnG n=1 Tax=Pararhodobacter zhoushanensis TaxID=2479545 RepID=A0ABT3H042_9RHOB|nr:phosphonate C-P lyase system protein PhnG [Pararhodobacter zhoushanensis]MCW1933153.1 phosphonate C-P lyase system protein PhnG [Pararhodobacter zhoushanensis]